jgi:hypothetical protein
MYINVKDSLNYKRLFTFIVGNRGGGKTYSAKRFMIEQWLNFQSKSFYIRRYDTEFEDAKNFILDIQHEYPDMEFTVNNYGVYLNGEIFIYFRALTKSVNIKSSTFPDVGQIVFDEFIIDKGLKRYLKNEVESFLELYETISRTREVKCLFLSNAVTVVNPYFTYFRIPCSDNEIIKGKHWIVVKTTNEEFINHKKKTKFGELIANTNYSRYAIDNQYLRDNNDFVLSKNNKSEYQGGIKYLDKYYGIWLDIENCKIFVNNKVNQNSKNMYCILNEDMTENLLLVKNKRKIPLIDLLDFGFKHGYIFYENIGIKSQFMDIARVLKFY